MRFPTSLKGAFQHSAVQSPKNSSNEDFTDCRSLVSLRSNDQKPRDDDRDREDVDSLDGALKIDIVRTMHAHLVIFLVVATIIPGLYIFAREWCKIHCQVFNLCKSVGEEGAVQVEEDESQPLVEVAKHDDETGFVKDKCYYNL